MTVGSTLGLTWDPELLLWLCPLRASDFEMTSAAALERVGSTPHPASSHASEAPLPAQLTTERLEACRNPATKPETPLEIPQRLVEPPPNPVKVSRGTLTKAPGKPLPNMPRGRRKDTQGQGALLGFEGVKPKNASDPEANAGKPSR